MKKIPLITDRELEIMDVIWDRGECSAQEIAAYFLNPSHGGISKNTTYTFLKRLVDKRAIKRIDPGFVCRPLVTREQIQKSAGQSFLNRVYHGSLASMVAQFVDDQLSESERQKLKEIINNSSDETEKK